MVRNRRELGEGQLGCLVGLVLLLIAGLVAFKMIPIKVKAAELRNVVVDEGRSAGQHKDGEILKSILAKAEELELPVREKDVTIARSGGNIRIEVTYTVPVELPGYTYQWNFNHRTQNPIF